MFHRWRSLAGVSLTAGLVLIMSAVGALPVAAEKGDIWTQPGGTAEETSGHSEEVHLPCGNVDLWGDQLDSPGGTWVLYQKPPPNTDETEIASGTYSYSGDESMKIATIPMAAFHAATGPHFKVEVEYGNHKKSKTFWLNCQISISTATNPSSAAIGATLNDSATLSNGFSPTGTITFTLFNPSGVAAHTESVNVNGNATYSTAEGHVADQAGTWYWQAAYSGNGGNNAVTSGRTAEPVVISQAGPQISTTTNPASGVVGTTLKDAATLSGGYHPTGTITFTLYDPNEASAYTENVTVNGNGSYSTAQGFVANVAGTWHWSAAYSGDANNAAVHSLKADEPVVITEGQHQAQPSITTAPDPTSAVVGSNLQDTATLSGGTHPTGTITFTLYDPNGHSAYTENATVTGNGPYSTVQGFHAGMAGTWHWSAAYSGDTGNKAVHSPMADEPVVIDQAQPTITTSPDPTSALVGATLKDTATLTGYHPTGTITFTLYDPNGNSAYTENATVTGNGSYTTAHGFAANMAGTWHWSAAYSGDANNKAVHSLMADEPVVVTEEQQRAQPSISTVANPAAALVGEMLNDTATLSDGHHPTGTITFTLYDPNNVSAYTENVNVTGNGSYATVHGFMASMVGTWHWSAAYSGDANNKAVHSLMADEPVVVGQAGPSISTSPDPTSAVVGTTLNDKATLSGYHPTGTITFTLYDPSDESAYTELVAVDGNGQYSTVHGFMASMVGTWHWSAAYSGDANNKAVHSLMADEPVVIGQAAPSISTVTNPHTALVGATLNDTATLSGGYHPTGTITFTLFDPDNESAYTENVTVSGNGSYSTAEGFDANMAGTWHWSAAYSGDANNKAVHSLMADEPVVVTEEQHQAQPSITTSPNPTTAAVGTTLNDTATLSGGSEPTGTITFTLFDPNGESAYTEEVAVDGNGPYSTESGFMANMVGTWHWSAAYSGDEGNAAVHSLMADEPVVVSQAGPSISTVTNPATGIVGASLNDTATLSGGYHPTGTITFTLYDQNNVSAYTENVTVTGNGSYSTAHGFAASAAGTWHWSAAYSGDANNKAVHSLMADEPVTITTGEGGVLAATGSTPLAEALALFLVGFGTLAILVAAVARRRRQA